MYSSILYINSLVPRRYQDAAEWTKHIGFCRAGRLEELKKLKLYADLLTFYITIIVNYVDITY